jgi:creatinine amidohydrolase
MERRIEHLKPREVREAIAHRPLLYQPLGTVEWHGEQNILGLDSLKAHELCMRAAEISGGLVAPPVYGGVGGLDEPFTWIMDPENDPFSILFRPWLEKLCRETARLGFKAIILLTGHYGAAQQIVVRDVAVRMSRLLGIPILGTPEYFLAHDEGYYGDHAAWGETSLMMYLDPPSVDLSRLGDAPHQGVHGQDPKTTATAADGERMAKAIIRRLAAIGTAMPTWDAATLQRFQNAEAALVAKQMQRAGTDGQIWSAWTKIGTGVFNPYGQLLAEGRFEEIEALVEKL